jgi:large subunit ribosomal protein L3
MLNTILGSKGSTSQTFVEGFRVSVTKVVAGPCVVTQIKNMDRDGYWSVQLGFGTRTIKNVSKPVQGHLKGALKEEKRAPRFLREVRLSEEPTFKVGDTVKLSDIFRVGDVVTVTGTSKGKGFASGIKLHGFHGGPKTHGQSDRHRAPGSVGQTTTPGRVYRGKRMAARMGANTVTVSNLHVISIDAEKNEMQISGQLPGNTDGLLTIKKVKSGSLHDLATETVAQVVEGEAPAEGEGEEAKSEAPVAEEKKEETPNA